VTSPLDPGDLSLHEVLARLGWRSEPSQTVGRRLVFDADGQQVGGLDIDGAPLSPGPLTADATWRVLRARGLVQP